MDHSICYPSYDGRESYPAQLIPSKALPGKRWIRNIDSEDICHLDDESEEQRSPMLWLDQDQETILCTGDSIQILSSF